MKYVIYFDDGSMLGNEDPQKDGTARYVREFPNAHQFTAKMKAERAAAWCNKPSSIERVEAAEM